MRPIPHREPRKEPRHRVDPARKNRHLLITGCIVGACTTVAITVGLATGGVALGATGPTPTSTPTATPHPAAAASITPAPTAAPAVDPEPLVRSSVIAADGASNGPVTGGTVVTVTGADLDSVGSATFGGIAGQVTSATADTVTIQTPPSTNLNPGPVPVELFDTAGTAVDVVAAAAVASVAAPASVPASPLTFNYIADPGISAQTAYAKAHWQDYNSADYGVIRGNDCVNFTSQSLVARGWAMDADWSFSPDTHVYSPAWSSSTAFAAYLGAHPERATALGDDQRALVKVGDIVQFDWDFSGDEDHTGIVTSVEKSAAGVKIHYSSHTFNTFDKSVDESLTNSGGTVSYWSVK